MMISDMRIIIRYQFTKNIKWLWRYEFFKYSTDDTIELCCENEISNNSFDSPQLVTTKPNRFHLNLVHVRKHIEVVTNIEVIFDFQSTGKNIDMRTIRSVQMNHNAFI